MLVHQRVLLIEMDGPDFYQAQRDPTLFRMNENCTGDDHFSGTKDGHVGAQCNHENCESNGNVCIYIYRNVQSR